MLPFKLFDKLWCSLDCSELDDMSPSRLFELSVVLYMSFGCYISRWRIYRTYPFDHVVSAETMVGLHNKLDSNQNASKCKDFVLSLWQGLVDPVLMRGFRFSTGWMDMVLNLNSLIRTCYVWSYVDV